MSAKNKEETVLPIVSFGKCIVVHQTMQKHLNITNYKLF